MVDHFQAKAQDWDQCQDTQKRSEIIGQYIVEHVLLKPHMKVMDFGAGTGLLLSHLLPHVGEMLAVDTSAAMLDQLRQKEALQGKVRTYQKDLLSEPLDESFDLIISAMALHHVEDVQALLDCFAAHLKTGGQIALADLESEDGSFHAEGTEGVHHHGFRLEELTKQALKAGFQDILFQTVYHLQKHGRSYPVFLLRAHKA